MAHLPYNSPHMLRHVEGWGKGEMLPPTSPAPPAPGPSGSQWPAAASELCEVVLTECLRQQQQLAQQQAVVHEAPSTQLTIDASELGLQAPLPPAVHMVSAARPRRCPHHQRHHHHHHHPQGGSGAQQQLPLSQEKLLAMGYNVAPYPCRYRLPSSDLLPNHDELVAAGAIPATPPPVLAPPPPAPTTPATAGKQRKPRSARGSRGARGPVRKPAPAPAPPEGAPPPPAASTSTFPCPECGKKFLWASRLVVHRRSHTGEKPFPCTQCGAAFAQRWILAVHMRSHNPPEAPPQVQEVTPEAMAPRPPQPLSLGPPGQQVEI